MKIISVLALISSMIPLTLAQDNSSRGSAPAGIPIVTASTPPFGMEYKFVENENRNPDDLRAMKENKRQQYELEVKEGRRHPEEAADSLKRLDQLPRNQERRGALTVIAAEGKLWIAYSPANGPKAWSRIEDNVNVNYHWSGGDAWSLNTGSEPYSVAGTILPILPFQLPAVRAFADVETEGKTGKARMFVASLSADQYVRGTLRFEGGRLVETEVPGLERTRFSDYTNGPVPMPKRIEYEGKFDRSGNPQVVRTYIGKPITNPQIPLLKDLAPATGINVIDYRSDPNRQFRFTPNGGSILEQSESGIATPLSYGAQTASGSSVPFSTWLLGASLLLLAGTAVARLRAGRRGK
ncbi:MAG: hypothetical protein C4320_00125 [Armatimonadota bacterium]